MKEFILKSSWVKEDTDRFMGGLFECNLPPFVKDRIIKINIKERLMADNFVDSFKLGRIGKQAIAYDYYVEMNFEGLSEAQRAVIAGFWQGFLSGRYSKHNGNSRI